MTNKEIYLDNAATTRPSESVLQAMDAINRGQYFNSAALYKGAINVKRTIDEATSTVHAKLTKSKLGTFVFTSGATESNNMVIFGKITRENQHLLVLAGEHSSIYAPAVHLKNNGYDVEFVPLLPSGAIDLETLSKMIRPTTALFVFGMANSDTGYLQDVESIVGTIRSGGGKNCHIHCDAVQGFAKFDFDVQKLGLDSAAVSAHKIHGPKGIGGLWLREGVNIRPIMFGGAQQDYRPGTEYTAGIVGFAEAVRSFSGHDKIAKLHKRLIAGLPPSCKINGTNNNPCITNILLPNILGQTVMNHLSEKGIYVGLGSACASKASKNRTLLAMGIQEKLTKNVLRVSLSSDNTEEDVDVFLQNLHAFLNRG